MAAEIAILTDLDCSVVLHIETTRDGGAPPHPINRTMADAAPHSVDETMEAPHRAPDPFAAAGALLCNPGAAANLGSIRAGIPPAIECAETSDSTILPAITTAPSPILTPGLTVTRPASHTPLPISIGFAVTGTEAVIASGISTSDMMQWGPIMEPLPMVTPLPAAMSVPKLISTSSPI